MFSTKMGDVYFVSSYHDHSLLNAISTTQVEQFNYLAMTVEDVLKNYRTLVLHTDPGKLFWFCSSSVTGENSLSADARLCLLSFRAGHAEAVQEAVPRLLNETHRARNTESETQAVAQDTSRVRSRSSRGAPLLRPSISNARPSRSSSLARNPPNARFAPYTPRSAGTPVQSQPDEDEPPFHSASPYTDASSYDMVPVETQSADTQQTSVELQALPAQLPLEARSQPSELMPEGNARESDGTSSSDESTDWNSMFPPWR